jgi:hypothetical protein
MIVPHARNIEVALVVDETAVSSKANGYNKLVTHFLLLIYSAVNRYKMRHRLAGLSCLNVPCRICIPLKLTHDG